MLKTDTAFYVAVPLVAAFFAGRHDSSNKLLMASSVASAVILPEELPVKLAFGLVLLGVFNLGSKCSVSETA